MIIKGWFLLRIHKNGLCQPFHYKKAFSFMGRPKGWCPVLERAHWELSKEKEDNG